MPVPDGSLVLLDYMLWVDGKLQETTSADVAKQHDLFRENARYVPFMFTVGMGEIIPGLERELEALDADAINVPRTVTVQPKDAFGDRHADDLVTVGMKSFGGEQVQVGADVRIKDREGVVVRLGGGRVTVDLNHPFAGKAVVYDYTIRAILTEPRARVEARIKRSLGEDVRCAWDDAPAPDGAPRFTVWTPPRAVHDQQWVASRSRIVKLLRRDHGTDLEVSFIETYPVPAKPVPKPAPAPSAAPEELAPDAVQ